MSQEEHILHQLKELRDWTLHINKQVMRIVWMQCILTAIMVVAILILMLK
jgi:hypothetical protein